MLKRLIPEIFKIILISMTFFLIYADSDSSEKTTQTEPKPLWELGLFNVWTKIPHYRGSNEYNSYALPLPYLLYRGKFIRADKDGVKGIFKRTEHFESSMSIYGNPPVNEDNKARTGMPELDSIVEIGPSVKWYFSGRKEDKLLYLRVAARMVMTMGLDQGLDFAWQGLRGGVKLIYRHRSVSGKNKWSYGLSCGIDMADNEFTSYYYDVPEEYSNENRKTYLSKGGYAGFNVSMNVVRKFVPDFSFGLFSRWENINGASFEESPLVKTKNNYITGCAFIWKITESKKMSYVRDDSL